MRGLHWFRNDVRLHDNSALAALADRVDEWLPVFVLDPTFLEGASAGTPRTRFLLDCLARLDADLRARKVPLQVLRGDPVTLLPRLMREASVEVLSFGLASTPLARRRDERVRCATEGMGASALITRDHTIFGAEEIRTKAGGPYSVYTPYRNAWWRAWHQAPRLAAGRVRLPRRPIHGYARKNRFEPTSPTKHASSPSLPTGGEAAARRRLRRFLDGPIATYPADRDRPDLDGTSRLSPYLRFGAISVRRCFTDALRVAIEEPSSKAGAAKWLDELIWREFYNSVLESSPHVLTRNYRSEYDGLEWNQAAAPFEAWSEGRTGFPFVDAGMRQLRETGWMHNRVRMVVASFLTKDLLIDWRRGERFFFASLVDGDPASNNGGWQWAASTGTDAQPYFRIFNPVAQGERWDPEGRYVRRWIPELRSITGKQVHAPWRLTSPPASYPPPIVDHALARERALAAFKKARRAGGRS